MTAQQILERSAAVVPAFTTQDEADKAINAAAVMEITQSYTDTHIDPSFSVASVDLYYSKPLMREMWQVILCCQHGPLGVLQVDPQTGQLIPLTEDEIRILREKALIYAARKKGILPVDEDGYVLGEYARRMADRYLGDQIGMFFGAKEPVFVFNENPLWQLTVFFKMQSVGPYTLATIDVDAKTGEPITLTEAQIQKIKDRTHDIVDHRTQATAA